jgi:glutamate-5-semialdehyde dehydrogenase
MDPIRNLINLLGQNARIAAKTLRSASTQQKNNALNNIALYCQRTLEYPEVP